MNNQDSARTYGPVKPIYNLYLDLTTIAEDPSLSSLSRKHFAYLADGLHDLYDAYFDWALKPPPSLSEEVVA